MTVTGLAGEFIAEARKRVILVLDPHVEPVPVPGDDAGNARVRLAFQDAPALVTAMEAVLKLHQPAIDKVAIICERHGSYEGIRRLKEAAYRAEIAACPDCSRKELTVCAHCACPNDAWPCPTVRAIEAAVCEDDRERLAPVADGGDAAP